ncbi:MAG TPA: FecR domain-containing protein [Kofleriaceae bacterium]|jgi:hypothetical protein
MLRYLAAALALLLLLAGLGAVLHDRIFGGTPATAATARRPAPAAEPMLGPSLDALELTSVDGVVERRTATGWRALSAHDPIASRDTIRTREGGRARIETGAIAVELADRSELTVGDMSATSAEVSLDDGRVSARNGKTGRKVRVVATDAGTVAESEVGKFDVLAGTGQAAVASEEGAVAVRAHGGDVTLHPGEQTFVAAAAPPTAPVTIPGSLFLKVGLRDRLVAGTTAPGARVAVGGTAIAADGAGAFQVPAPPPGAPTSIEVIAEDVLGRTVRRIVTLRRPRRVPPPPPPVQAEVQWK